MSQLQEISESDLGWVAGIIEGEGYISIVSQQKGRYLSVTVGVNMTDLDVLSSLLSKTGYGTIHGPQIRANCKPIWQWVVRQREDVADLLYTILPFMHERRSLKIIEALDLIERLRDEEAYRLQFFICGHPKTEENIMRTSTRTTTHCRICKLAWGKTRNRKQEVTV